MRDGSEAGVYLQAALPTGSYRVEVTSQGFRRAVVHKIKVDVGTPAAANITLEVGATTESVEVQAEATAIVTATAAIGTTDISTTNDPGGRIVQLVLRINF